MDFGNLELNKHFNESVKRALIHEMFPDVITCDMWVNMHLTAYSVSQLFYEYLCSGCLK